MRSIFVFLSLFLFLNTGFATDVPGYIVSAEHDTLFGEIHIQKTGLISIGLVSKGLDLEVFHSYVI